MKTINVLTAIILALTILGCKKDSVNIQLIPIPNGDFEAWDGMPELHTWQTNSCPACLPPYETYIVQKVTDASQGQFAAKFIHNKVYSSFANNKFPVSLHPTSLTGYIKSNIALGDTATIQVILFSGHNIIDNGFFHEISSNLNYREIEIPITQTSLTADSATIKIIGGKMRNTELYVDNLVFLKRD